MKCESLVFITIISCFCFVKTVYSIRCFDCSSGADPKGTDNCGAYKKFDTVKNQPVECTSDESPTPGSFCLKRTMQSPKGFIWDGRWRQVIRRCASVSETGVTNVCNWGVEENGVYWEECYCSGEACNSATNAKISVVGLAFTFLTLLLMQ